MSKDNSFPTKLNIPEIEIKNLNTNLIEDKIFSSLKLNINAYKEVRSVVKDEEVIKKSISLIPNYLKEFNLCSKCANNSIRDCLQKGKLGYRLTPAIKFKELDFVNAPCYKLKKVNEKMHNFNLYYDSPINFYLEGINLISFYNDLSENKKLKNTSEIGLLFDYVTEIIDKKDFKTPGYLISSKKNGLSSRILKAIGILFMNLNVSVTYVDSKSIFDSFFYDDSDEYIKIYKTLCTSKVLLMDNIDQVADINSSLNEEYMGNLLTERNNEGLITFATTTKPMNHKYLATKFFNDLPNKSTYENILKVLFNLITVNDSI